MSKAPRKKSPRAPSLALDDAIERALKIYDKERRHAAPTDVVAQDLGYKSANNGAALSAIASLRYYGLLERPQEGQLAVSKDVEVYQFAPSREMRKELEARWLKNPQLFSDLLEKYVDDLPSDATLKFELVERGFNPATADAVISVFRRSVDFVDYFASALPESDSNAPQLVAADDGGAGPVVAPAPDELRSDASAMAVSASGADRIPVRLPGGRRAWLEIPTPFYSADKDRLKAQIDLLLAEDED